MTDTNTSFICPRCLKTSHHSKDIEQGYCSHCHAWTGENVKRPTEAQLTRLFAIAASRGYRADTVKHLIVWLYRYPTTSELTLVQWAVLCKLFETLPKVEGE